MFKKFLLFSFIATAFCCTACSDDDKDSVGGDFTVTVESLHFNNEGGTDKFGLQTNTKWSIECPDWITCDPSSGDATTINVKVTCEENTGTDSREGAIVITCGSATKEVAVTQDNSIILSVDNDYLTIDDYTGGTGRIEITYEGDNITINASDWIIYNIEGNTLTFEVEQTTYSRTGTITITCGDAETTITVKQSGDPSAIGIGGDTPEEVVMSIGLGWNYGNQMDAYNYTTKVAEETYWTKVKCDQSTMNAVKAAGFQTVRIPVTWLGHIGDAPDYTIDADWMARVHEIVGYCESAGLNAIINIHHDGADSENWLSIKDAADDEAKNTQIKEQITAMWKQIAEEFKNEGNFLMFEAFNEIHDGSWGWGTNRSDGGKQYGILNDWNELFVNTVRGTGGNNSDRWLGIPVYCTSASLFEYFEMPANSKNVAVAIHYYEPGELALGGNNGTTVTKWGENCTGTTASWGNEDYVKLTFSRIQSRARTLNCPVYFGEMGCVHLSSNINGDERYRLYYLEYITKACREYNIAPIYWDNNGTGTGKDGFGIINHSSGAYITGSFGEEVTNAMVKGFYTDDDSYTLDSIESNAPTD